MKSRRQDDKIFRTTDKKVFKCFKCGKPGHKQYQCTENIRDNCENKSKFKRWCNNCKNPSHDTKYCRRLKTSVKYSAESDGASDYHQPCDDHFAMTARLLHTQSDSACSVRDSTRLLVDTGATSHIITDKCKFISFDKTFNPSHHCIELADGSRNDKLVVGRGDASVIMTDSEGIERNVILKNALCIPSFPQDIFSVHAANQQGVSLEFSPESSCIKTRNGTIFNVETENKLYFVNKISCKANSSRSLNEWHSILGHCNKDDVLKLQNVVNGMNISDKSKSEPCETCIKGKFAQYRNKNPDRKAQEVLELVHCDIAGPVDPVAKCNYKYAINFVDDKSGYIFVYLLKAKSEAPTALKQFLADSAPYGNVKCVRSDNALEFTGNEFESILRERGVKHEFSAPYSPHQNGTAERSWRSLFEMTRCLIIEAKIPKTLWSYALKTAAHIRNRCFNNRTESTPYEVLTSRRPNLNNMHKFGSKCFAYVYEKKKLDDRAEEGIFVGYDPSSPAYFVFMPHKNNVVKARMVKFVNAHSDDPIQEEEEMYIPIENPRPTTEDVEPTTNEENQRYPQRNRLPPKYLDDYVKCSIDYCYRISDIPNNYQEAIKSQDQAAWKKAMDDEILSLEDNNTYELTTLPDGCTSIGSRWVFAVKLGPDDEEKYKARLVAKGYSQVHGIDYQETFSPTAKITSIRMLMQLAVQNDYYINQMDVKSAYLNADIDAEIYLDQPEGYCKQSDNGSKLVWKLKKSLYGLKQSGRNWNELFHTFLSSDGFKQSLSDTCVYTKLTNESIIIVIIWVDDVLIACNDLHVLDDFKNNLSQKFRMKDLGELSWFLGIKFDQTDNCITMNQSKNISKMLHRFNMNDCHPKPSPCVATATNFDIADSKACNQKLYQEIIGSLIYVMSCTRPDICFIVSKLSQFMHSPTNTHMNMAKNVLKYLKGTMNYCLTFKKSNEITLLGYSDSDWGSSSDRKSISGYCFKMCDDGPLISWRSKKQPIVSLSSCEAEYVAMTSAIQEAKFLKMLMLDMNFDHVQPVKLFADNQGAIALAKNPVHHQRTKHIDIRYHFIREEINNKSVDVQFISTHGNLADVFTKAISKNKCREVCKQFGLCS